MIKIIDGYIFDTSKMELIVSWRNRYTNYYIYKGNLKMAIVSDFFGVQELREISEGEFKNILSEHVPEMYIKLFSENLEDA